MDRIPSALENYIPDVKAIRELTGLSQKKFAEKFYLGLRNIQKWEQNITVPSEGVRTLLWLIENNHQIISAMLNEHRIDEITPEPELETLLGVTKGRISPIIIIVKPEED